MNLDFEKLYNEEITQKPYKFGRRRDVAKAIFDAVNSAHDREDFLGASEVEPELIESRKVINHQHKEIHELRKKLRDGAEVVRKAQRVLNLQKAELRGA